MKIANFIIIKDTEYRDHLEDAYGLGYDRGIHGESYVRLVKKGIDTYNGHLINMIRNLKSENQKMKMDSEELKAELIRNILKCFP